MPHTGSYDVLPVVVLCLEHTSSWYVTDIVWFGFMVRVHLRKSLITLINSWQFSGLLTMSIRSVVCIGFSRRSGRCIIHAVSKMVVLVTRFLSVSVTCSILIGLFTLVVEMKKEDEVYTVKS